MTVVLTMDVDIRVTSVRSCSAAISMTSPLTI
jgi:hypothetical protein